eukprot:GGOE01036827.1.p1 GENE.GGOE01036827.1~~GGOE01036827.1.p1  ORF type:complete len:416 (-),score=102.55 GGOE01036827.1:89-1294(-)
MPDSPRTTQHAEFDAMVQRCLQDALTAPVQAPAAYCQLFPDLHLSPSDVSTQFGKRQPMFLPHPDADGAQSQGVPDVCLKAAAHDPYPPHIEAILARKKYEMPPCDEIESEELEEAEAADLDLPLTRPSAAGLKVDSYVDESHGYIPSTSTPRSSASTPRNRTPILPSTSASTDPSVAQTPFHPKVAEPLPPPVGALANGEDDSDSGDDPPLQLPDGAEEGVPTGVRFSPSALTLHEIQKAVIDAEELPQRKRTAVPRGRSSSVDFGQDLSSPFHPLSSPPSEAPEGMPLQPELPNVVTEETGQQAASSELISLSEGEREMMGALRCRSAHHRHLEDFPLPMPARVQEKLLEGAGPTSSEAVAGASDAECSDEVQPFALEEGFDYDNVKLTPKARDRFGFP